MNNVPINFWAVLAAAIAQMALGALWYSTALFGKPWMGLVGKTPESMKQTAAQKMAFMYMSTFVCAIIMAYIMAHFIFYTESNTIVLGLQTGWWAWVGFVATTSLINSLFAGRSWKLYVIDVGYHLVSLLAMGMILAIWR
jgi:hypothetical protein